MGKYRVSIKPSVADDLDRIPKVDRIRILKRIDKLGDVPRTSGCLKLSMQERYRLRQGNYRILYEVEDENRMVTVVKIGHRRKIYKSH